VGNSWEKWEEDLWEEYGKIWGNLWFIDGTLRKHAHGKINRNNIAGGFSSSFCLKMFVL
jgi:hypothetical protein